MHDEMSTIWKDNVANFIATQPVSPNYTTSSANHESVCPVHPGHVMRNTENWKIPSLPLFNQVKACRTSMKGKPSQVAFHQVLNNLTQMIAGEPWPISLLELAHFLSFPPIPTNRNSPWNPFKRFLEGCLSCDADQYGKIRRSHCETGHDPNIYRTSARCFHIGEFLKDKHDVAMKVMKYSMQPPVLMQPYKEYLQDFNHSSQFGGMNKPLEFGARHDSEYHRIHTKTFNPRIFACALGSSLMDQEKLRPSDCKLFSRSYSSYGVAYTFNSKPHGEILRNTSENRHQMDVLGISTRSSSHLHRVTPETGSFNILQLTLQLSETHFHGSLTHGNSESKFRLSLHDPDSLADLRDDFITLHAGKHHILKVEASLDKASDGIRSMHETVRGCLFPEESEGRLDLFKSYSQSGCLLECNLKEAYKICRCLPWNYLHFNASLVYTSKLGLTDLCDFEGNFCVERVLESKNNYEGCGCLPSCNKAVFTHRLTTEDIKVSKFCSPGK